MTVNATLYDAAEAAASPLPAFFMSSPAVRLALTSTLDSRPTATEPILPEATTCWRDSSPKLC